MTAPFIYLRGFAAPYLQAEKCNGRLEFVDPCAFDKMLNRPHNIFLNFGDHDAPTICRPMTLFSTSYGLAFSAPVSAATWGETRDWICKAGHNFCSVNFISERIEDDRLDDGTRCTRIVEAEIDHITISDSHAIYKGTGVWPAVVVGKFPHRLDAMASQWEQGYATWRARCAVKPPARANATSRDGVGIFSPSMMAHYAAFRQRWATNVSRAGYSERIWAHAAFSKAAGFDGDFKSLLARARR